MRPTVCTSVRLARRPAPDPVAVLALSATLALSGACAGEIGDPLVDAPDPCATLCPDCGPELDCLDQVDDDCDGQTDCDDDDCALATACLPPGGDADGDGLPDAWELAAGDATHLDPALADTDADGTTDDLEDPDNDGLSNLEEFALGRLPAATGLPPHPLRFDLPVELDQMAGRDLNAAVLADAATAFAALPRQNTDGTTGVNLLVYRDESAVAAVDFDGTFDQRWNFFAAHGPRFTDQQQPPIPYAKLLHAIVAARRLDLIDRTGEAVPESTDVERTGLFVFYDAIAATAPFCGAPAAVPPLPAVTLERALANTLAHELGHLLQVGHDTAVGGGVNAFNVMAVPANCTEAQMRFHGLGNNDPSLGNTETVAAPRFSRTAFDLMRFDSRLSVETAELNDVDM